MPETALLEEPAEPRNAPAVLVVAARVALARMVEPEQAAQAALVA
jgi:hypothetical protein